MKTYGLIGYPLSHSFSKQYFTEKIKREGITDAVFHAFPLSKITELHSLLKNNPQLKGLAVTIPYKEQVLQYVDVLSKEVQMIGAANCIKIEKNRLTAHNTDITGFERSFVKRLKPIHKKALVLGTGGASKAVQFVLNKLGIDFLIVSRNAGQEKKIITYEQVTEELLREYKIVINTTPLGMAPDEDTCPAIAYSFLTADHYLYDLVYAPAKTVFLQKGEERGATIENGFEMLIIQAEENWRIWNKD